MNQFVLWDGLSSKLLRTLQLLLRLDIPVIFFALHLRPSSLGTGALHSALRTVSFRRRDSVLLSRLRIPSDCRFSASPVIFSEDITDNLGCVGKHQPANSAFWFETPCCNTAFS